MRVSPGITGLSYGDLHEKIMLYADNMMLFLGDTTASLADVTAVIAKFGHYSGLTINWSEPALMVLDGYRAVDLIQINIA